MGGTGRNGSAPRRALIVLLLAAIAAAGYGLYRWRSPGPSPAPQNRQFTVSPIKASQPTAIPTMASPVPTTPSTAKSLFELHAAFRESQRCIDERIIIRGNVSYHLDVAPPPHIPGCDDMKGALRKVYEATTAAAKAGDLDIAHFKGAPMRATACIRAF
jgi:hypothetical protein